MDGRAGTCIRTALTHLSPTPGRTSYLFSQTLWNLAWVLDTKQEQALQAGRRVPVAEGQTCLLREFASATPGLGQCLEVRADGGQ